MFLFGMVSLGGLFSDPLHEKVYVSLLERLGSKGWVAAPPMEGGNFQRRGFCSEAVSPEDCGEKVGRPGAHPGQWVELSLLQEDPKSPAFGWVFRWSQRPLDAPGLSFYWSVGGRNLTGDTFSFDVFAAGAERPFLSVGPELSYQLGLDRVSVPLGDGRGGAASLFALRANPEDFPSLVLQTLGHLEERVRGQMVAGYSVCRYGPYEGGGMPPECRPSPAIQQEKDLEWSHFTRSQTLSTAWIQAEGENLVGVLREWVPEGLP